MKSEHLEIFGIQISNYNKESTYSKLNNVLADEKRSTLFIVTLNPEILLEAKKDPGYARVLNSADLKIVDGVGIKLAAFLKRKKIGERMTGADLAEYILDIARGNNLAVGYVFEKDGFSSAKDIKNNPKFPIANSQFFFIGKDWEKEGRELIQELKNSEVLLVGLGAPFQENFVWKMKDKLPNLKLAMGVGGTFDYWTGKKKRAPLFFRKIGLEWLWRLVIQPNRIGRIWNATVVFLYKAIIK